MFGTRLCVHTDTRVLIRGARIAGDRVPSRPVQAFQKEHDIHNKSSAVGGYLDQVEGVAVYFLNVLLRAIRPE